MSTFPTNVSPSSFFSPGFQPSIEQSRIDKKAIVLKHIAQSQRLIAVRPAAGLEVRPRPEILSTSIAELDALSGGFPRGCLTEICGPASSGKTSVLLATIAKATRNEEACALIDASDGFDPISGAAAGLDFGKLLWVRCGSSLWDPAPSVVKASYHRVRHETLTIKDENHVGADASPAPTRSARRLRRAWLARPDEGVRAYVNHISEQRKASERKLEQVLKATDLILQSGGFGLVALDLAGISEKFVRRIPLASWFRFQRAVEHTRTALLVVSEFPCAQTCAVLVVKVCSELSAISSQLSAKPTHAQVLQEMQIEAEIVRSRLECKPAQSVKASFSMHAVRTG